MNTDIKNIPAPSSPYHKVPHYFGIVSTFLTFVVVTLGGMVKSNEAGLTIAEGFVCWWMPDWYDRPGLRLEFLHRMNVGILMVCVLGMTALTLMYDRRPAMRRFAKLLPLFLLAQAFVGFLTVELHAHWYTSIPHVLLGHALLATMACFTTMLSPLWTSAAPMQSETETPSLQRLARATMIAVFIQLFLGAAIRHDDKGQNLLDERYWVFYTHLGLHVAGAFMVAYFVARLLMRVFHHHRGQAQIMAPARAVMMLLGVQFLLGPAAAMFKVIYSRDEFDTRSPPPIRLWVATSHVVVGALILTFSAVLYARAKRYCGAALPAARAGGTPALRGASA